MVLLNAHKGVNDIIVYIAELKKCVSGVPLINPVHRLFRCHGKHCWQTGNVAVIFFFFFFFRRAAFNSQQQKYQCFGIPVSLNLSCVFNRNRISCHWSSLWQTLLKYFPNCKIHHLHFSAWNCGQVVSLWVHPQISSIIWAMILEFVRHVSMFSTWNVSCHLWTNHAVHLIRQML